MTSEKIIVDDDHIDDDADAKIIECLNLENPKSFFLFAGAGSGKTGSLIKALKKLTSTRTIGDKLRLRGQKVGVITYTNHACDEIKRRLDNDTLIFISTIHSFIWDLIRGFDSDIKKWLESYLKQDIAEQKLLSPREGTKAAIDRSNKITSAQERLRALGEIKKFIYSPDSSNSESNALSHWEVLQIGASFLTQKPLMQQILIRKFPILLIDECQDTNKTLMEAFLLLHKMHNKRFSLGLLGDSMQRIYGDGKADLGNNLPVDWEKPVKKMNHRSPERIIQLLNKIRSDVDGQTQQARQNKKGGVIRFFIVPSDKDKQNTEASVLQQMAQITGDRLWGNREVVTSLILEHHMAAIRMGFGEMFEALHSVEQLRIGLLDGTLAEIRIFSEIILPLLEAYNKGDNFSLANVMKANSPLFEKGYMAEHRTEARELLKKARSQVEDLGKVYHENPDITFGEILEIIYRNVMFRIPDRYKPILIRTVKEKNVILKDDGSPESSIDIIDCLDNFLKTKFQQIKPYVNYISGQSPFFTHQGVKGLEFPRVMALIDDSSARGFLFTYDKLFGIKDKTDADIKNEREGKETGIDRTRRLFYVICSRAEESLAIVAYSQNPSKLATNLLGKKWFSEEEIITLRNERI